ncbi:tRNA (5-methylaminomethyl-2-thiouridine)(34)-methyltransferase MnmD [Myroides sp. LJL115]
MKRTVIITQDGSSSISLNDWGESYHSVHGAVQEAKHVYLDNGLHHFKDQKDIAILEMGFGTGLNTFLTYLKAKEWGNTIAYSSIEGFPISTEELRALNYRQIPSVEEDQRIFDLLHQCKWDTKEQISSFFSLLKMHNTFEEQVLEANTFDLIYFDVFGYPYQPELWSQAIFEKMFQSLKPGGILTTYACRGVIKRNMQNVGFRVEKVAGPPGKREMIVAYK